MQIRNNGAVSRLLASIEVPRFFNARQSFARPVIAPARIPAIIRQIFDQPELARQLQPGQSIAITAGSRGIRNIDLITRAIVDVCRDRGCRPFVVAAMGSHGQATPAGQLAVLASLNITEASMCCPVQPATDVRLIGHSADGRPVFLAETALAADGIIAVNRIKPHTAFRGAYESGLCKMLTVGLGLQAGAQAVHADGAAGLARNIPAMARVVIGQAPLLLAVAIIENAYDETCHLEGMLPAAILEREPALLQMAAAHMPRILVSTGDVLVIDEIGKNYAGTGVDPNIAGTFATDCASGGVSVQRTCLLRLSEATHGNALGVGLASAITQSLYNAIDPEPMYLNCLTSTLIRSAMIPCVLASDKEAIQFCLGTCVGLDKARPRLIRIANTLHLETIMLSEAYYPAVLQDHYPGLTALDEPHELSFDRAGNLLPA